jgi:hypothetical protein
MKNGQIASQEMIKSLCDEYDSIIQKLETGDIETKDASIQAFILTKELLSMARFGDGMSSLQGLPFDLDRILDHLNAVKEGKERTSERNYKVGCLAFFLKQYGASEIQAHKALSECLPAEISCSAQTIKKAQEKFEKEAYIPKGSKAPYLLDLYIDKIEWVLGQIHAPFPVQYKKAHTAYWTLIHDLERSRQEDGDILTAQRLCG